ncbi:hypothetical protein J437_LFUL002729 [Ladona fulva]|uniref:Protein kinase domain-containing protein n=1 Tax=Ladona fulva TaxID=123851 RepID=A0A8K0K2U7_LADFU|nr:hypothetical protein J437_LFUL002729 [Ladona fulva]
MRKIFEKLISEKLSDEVDVILITVKKPAQSPRGVHKAFQRHNAETVASDYGRMSVLIHPLLYSQDIGLKFISLSPSYLFPILLSIHENVLVSANRICKVADFGFARDVAANHVYERKSEGRLPIRWMAPESLYDNIFTTKSDVWSFGVFAWEVVTLGSTPYPGLAASDVMRKVRDGLRLEKPEHCRRELFNVMYYCWDKDPKERPTFGELVSLLEGLLLTETDYIELERFPDHCYYNVVSLSGEKL